MTAVEKNPQLAEFDDRVAELIRWRDPDRIEGKNAIWERPGGHGQLIMTDYDPEYADHLRMFDRVGELVDQINELRRESLGRIDLEDDEGELRAFGQY